MTIAAVLRSHLSCYPAMQIQDIYKLIHKAASTRFPLPAMHEFIESMRWKVHYSVDYERQYHPAYRVMYRNHLP